VNHRRVLGAALAGALAMAFLAGCTQNPTFASDGDQTGYVSGGGVYDEIKPADRKAAETFTAKLDTGKTITSADLLGKVHVLNFWFAACGPCRVEAPRLETAYNHYKGTIPFVGVNTYDSAPTARAFEAAHKVTYPSVIDVNTTAVQYAYSGFVPPDAVPVTLVIDKHGRVAARVTGVVEQPSILTDLIDRVVSEGQ
jgi:peroxiredoxin